MAVPTQDVVDRFTNAVNWIIKNPENHDQGSWWDGLEGSRTNELLGHLVTGVESLDELVDCGSTCCVAGTIALMAGERLYVSPDRSSWGSVYIKQDAGCFLDVDAWVAALLGMQSYAQASGPHPFAANGDIDTLRVWAGVLQRCADDGVDIINLLQLEFPTGDSPEVFDKYWNDARSLLGLDHVEPRS